MKRNNTLYTICFLLASMCINTACEDTLSESPDSSYERKDFFITDKQADMAVLGIYSVLPTIYGDKDGMAFPPAPMIHTMPAEPIATTPAVISAIIPFVPPTHG